LVTGDIRAYMLMSRAASIGSSSLSATGPTPRSSSQTTRNAWQARRLRLWTHCQFAAAGAEAVTSWRVGAFLSPSGHPRLVLDRDRLLALACQFSAIHARPSTSVAPPGLHRSVGGLQRKLLLVCALSDAERRALQGESLCRRRRHAKVVIKLTLGVI
jgi:hypothetical protein